jgi:hypothetical protein
MQVLDNSNSYELFNTIAEKVRIYSQLPRSMNGFTKAQYYKRIQKLIACGLVKRKLRILSLTSFGKGVNSGKSRIDIAVAEFYRFKGVRLGQRIERSRRFR